MLKPSLLIRRIDAIKEIKRELLHRRKEWAMADKATGAFMNKDHQKQFDTMFQLGCIINAMSDREYIDLIKKHNRKEKEKEEMENNQLFEK